MSYPSQDQFEGDDDIVITNVCQSQRKVPKRKRRCMDDKEITIIKKPRCLTDLSINFAQNMLHEQFPLCEGLEDTTLGPNLQFSVHSQTHWVCLSNVGCQKGEVNYYDSLLHGSLTLHLLKQMAAMLNEKGQEIIVKVKPVKKL
jgi:hypothetical protein